MTAEIISGKEVAKAIRAELKEEVAELEEKHGVVPGLSTVLVGEMVSYVKTTSAGDVSEYPSVVQARARRT